jgi:thiol-disulfide isomerase/thioredoxin
MRFCSRTFLAAFAVALLAFACHAQSAPTAPAAPTAPPNFVKVPPIQFSEPFPPAKFANLNTSPGQPATVDLLTYLGKKPIVFVYWMAGNPRAEKILQDTAAVVDAAGKDKVALLAVASPVYGSTDVTPIKTRSQALKLAMPVLYDEGFRVLQQLDVHAVPNISIVDGTGRLRLANGSALKQTLEYKLDLETAITRLATTGKIGTYGPLPQYYPVNELVGQKCPDFSAPTLTDPTTKPFSSMLQPDKLNVLVFWSVDCPHCKAAMPKLNEWLKDHPEGMNVITAARVTDDATQKRTAEYCRLSGFVFPTLVDKDLEIAGRYNVISTPTIVIIRPDGVIDSALTSGEIDIGLALQARKQQLLKGGAKS